LMIPLITVSLPSPKRGMLESVSLPPDQQILNAGDLTVRYVSGKKPQHIGQRASLRKLSIASGLGYDLQ
jgi:hypothetical protein